MLFACSAPSTLFSTVALAAGSCATLSVAAGTGSSASTLTQLLKFMTSIMNAHSIARNFLPFIAQLSSHKYFKSMVRLVFRSSFMSFAF